VNRGCTQLCKALSTSELIKIIVLFCYISAVLSPEVFSLLVL
jgi:hypothetical protein